MSLGSTCGAANEVSSTCGNSGGAGDFSFKWMAPYSGNFSFTTHSSTYDTVLQLSPWGSGTSLGCSDNADGTAQSAITMYISSGTTIRITVDGAHGTCGEFQLNITPEAANCGTNYCNTPPSPCHSPAGTCVNGACSYALLGAGTACNDGNSCTHSDTCNDSGACVGTAITCNSPPSQCHGAGSCSNGSCVYPARPSGSACYDGNSCTSGDYCNGSGACYGGTDTCSCPNGEPPCNGVCCGLNQYCYNNRFCRIGSSCLTGNIQSIEECPQY